MEPLKLFFSDQKNRAYAIIALVVLIMLIVIFAAIGNSIRPSEVSDSASGKDGFAFESNDFLRKNGYSNPDIVAIDEEVTSFFTKNYSKIAEAKIDESSFYYITDEFPECLDESEETCHYDSIDTEYIETRSIITTEDFSGHSGPKFNLTLRDYSNKITIIIAPIEGQ